MPSLKWIYYNTHLFEQWNIRLKDCSKRIVKLRNWWKRVAIICRKAVNSWVSRRFCLTFCTIERNGKRGLEQQLRTPASRDNSTTFMLLPKSKDYYHLNSLTHSQLNMPPFYYHFSQNDNWIKDWQKVMGVKMTKSDWQFYNS